MLKPGSCIGDQELIVFSHGRLLFGVGFLVSAVPVEDLRCSMEQRGQPCDRAVRGHLGTQTHLVLRRLQARVAVDRVEYVHHARVAGPEHVQVVTGQDAVEQVNVLLAPAHDGRVEATNLLKVAAVEARDAEAELAPIAQVMLEGEGVVSPGQRAAVLAIRAQHLGVVLREDDGEVDLAVLEDESADPVERIHAQVNVHVNEEEQGVHIKEGTALLQGQCSGEGPLDLHYPQVVARVAGLQRTNVGDCLLSPVVRLAVEQHDGQGGARLRLKAHILEVLHEGQEGLEPARQGQDEVNGCVEDGTHVVDGLQGLLVCCPGSHCLGTSAV